MFSPPDPTDLTKEYREQIDEFDRQFARIEPRLQELKMLRKKFGPSPERTKEGNLLTASLKTILCRIGAIERFLHDNGIPVPLEENISKHGH